jgi:hypothetical protein
MIPPNLRDPVMSHHHKGSELREALQFLGLAGPAELSHFPDFLVIAPPKTGTTWLARQLGDHPGIFIPLIKEIKYFSYRRRFESLHWYLSFFHEAAGRLKGEASANYAELPKSTIRLIKELNAELKLIYLMRDPIDRAWSYARWNQSHRPGVFPTFEGHIDDVPDALWQESFRGQSTVLSGDYLGQLRRWLDVFDRRQMFVAFSEQIESSPQALLNGIFDFLGVERVAQFVDARLSERVNAGVPRELTPELRTYLQRIYNGRTRQLAEFLRRELALEPPLEWNDSLARLDIDTPLAVDADMSSPDNLCHRMAESADDERLEELLDDSGRPHIAESYEEWNIVEFRGRYYGVPRRIGPVDFFNRVQFDRPEIIVAESAAEIRVRIDEILAVDKVETSAPSRPQEEVEPEAQRDAA